MLIRIPQFSDKFNGHPKNRGGKLFQIIETKINKEIINKFVSNQMGIFGNNFLNMSNNVQKMVIIFVMNLAP